MPKIAQITTIENQGELNLPVIVNASKVATDIMITAHACSDINPPRQSRETKKAEILAMVATQIHAK